MSRGRLIAFEGGEGSGKSTQAARLATRLGVVLTGEPGGTSVGARIRRLVLDPDVRFLDARAEALLMAADRAQHMAEVIGPALAEGTDVVTDRFVGSSLAYQGYGRQLSVDELREISAWATGGVDADLVLLLDLPADRARARLDGAPDRVEAEAADFHDRVVAGFRELAALDPGRWIVVDGDGTPDEVEARVLAAVSARLGL
jgi:dTMP kinase